MQDNSDPANGYREKVAHLLNMHREQEDIANDVEFQIMRALYDLRGVYVIEDMVRWTGWSRQTIYNKWKKHGFRVKNA